MTENLRYGFLFLVGAAVLFLPVQAYADKVNASLQMPRYQVFVISYSIIYTPPSVFLLAVWMQETGRGTLDIKWFLFAIAVSAVGHLLLTNRSPKKPEG